MMMSYICVMMSYICVMMSCSLIRRRPFPRRRSQREHQLQNCSISQPSSTISTAVFQSQVSTTPHCIYSLVVW